MLTITVLGDDHWDSENEVFTYPDAFDLELEHSLSSLSKWESKFEKPFLSSSEKTTEETMYYLEAMLQTPNVPPGVLSNISQENFLEINDYIGAKMTATWFREIPNGPKSREVITAELIYYWMIQFSVPFEAQHWHLNKLFTLIRVCNEKQVKAKPMSKADILAQNRQLNEERKAKFGTTG